MLRDSSKTLFFFFCGLLIAISSCKTPEEKKAEEKYYLPKAGGEVGEMLVVMDSAKWKGPLGRAIRQNFAGSVPGLPQDEPFFDLKYISPRRFNNVLKFARNIVVVLTLEGNSLDSRELRKNFTPESLERIRTDENLFMTTRKDEYARGQEIMYLFASTDEQLLQKLEENGDRLVGHFNQLEKKRIAEKLFARSENNISQAIYDDHQFHIKIPYGYDLAKNLQNFVWVRFLDPEFEQNFFVHHQPYVSDEIFSTKDMVSFREEITQTMLRDVEKPQLYMTYQPELPFQVKEVNFNGKYALETSGLWKLSDNSAGGPFLSYTFVDTALNRLYYLEGYAYAPGEDKLMFMREIGAILNSFETESERLASQATN